MATLIDSFSETNKNYQYTIYGATAINGAGETFLAISTYTILDSAKFYLSKTGSPTGNIYAKVYTISGTPGSAVPTGTALATSDAVDVSTLGGSFALITFTFSGSDRITLTSGTNYVLTVEFTGGNSSNYAIVGVKSTNTYSGHNGVYRVTSSWNGYGETCFYVYGVASATAPTVTTSTTTSITTTTATGNGNVTADGGSTITERGVCWGTSTNPTTAGSKATAAGTTGTYTASITGLSASTGYYVRAYAINAIGTSYGSNDTFTSSSGPLASLSNIVSISNITSITI